MAAAAYPPWVIFDEGCTLEVQGVSSSIADTNTLARCRTSTGHPIDVALCLSAPPEASRVCVQLPHRIVASYAEVVAAHGDSVLVMVAGIEDRRTRTLSRTTAETVSTDHFVYNAGDAAAEPPRPPSLSLLPPHSITYKDEERRGDGTSLLRRGDGDFLVAELKMEYVKERDDDDKVHKEAALHLLRSGSGEWRVKRPVIVSAGECVDDLASSWRNSMVIPVGDQMLCWVDWVRGLLFCDNVFDESPSRLRYVPLPVEADFDRLGSVCATADGSTIKVVNVFARCFCSGAGKSKCRGSHVHTWTLRMDVDKASWVMDGSLDSNQLWALDGYKGLPRVELDSPVVSMDDPDAICFVVCEDHHDFIHGGDRTMWRFIVDMKNKTLRSVFRCPEPEGLQRFTTYYDRYLPSTVSKYFNSKPSTGQPPGPAAQAKAMQNMMSSWIKNKLQAINSIIQAASPSSEAAILTALQAIPSLDRDELLKAYRILTLATHDDSGRRFKSLMGLPMDLRKDWVLMEIKTSEACVLCSACSADLQIKEWAHKRQHQ